MLGTDENPGVAPRAIEKIFTGVEAKAANGGADSSDDEEEKKSAPVNISAGAAAASGNSMDDVDKQITVSVSIL